jgi:ribulose-phosphate 3-epimerase
LAQSLQDIASSGAPWVHIDIMDGHFVPNLTFGPQTVADLRQQSGLFFDVHLMLDNPAAFIQPFAQAGAQLISIHVEPVADVLPVLQRIRHLGCQCGLVINPATPAEALKPFLGDIDLALVMSVQPGFGGQAFQPTALEKIKQLKAWRERGAGTFRIQVDGGIDATTGPLCLQAGADTLVVGTAFFRAKDPAALVHSLSLQKEP